MTKALVDSSYFEEKDKSFEEYEKEYIIFINIGMVLGITPVIGIPLPFFSYGGSSLWGFTILLSIFLRIDCERTTSY